MFLFQMCGIQPTWINRLKRWLRVLVETATAFSIFFVAFLVAHFVLQ